MKSGLGWVAVFILPASFYLISPGTMDAPLHANGITGLQLAVGILVGALYTANHFKVRIKTVFRELFTKNKKGTGAEG
jgi:hypothetical protein